MQPRYDGQLAVGGYRTEKRPDSVTFLPPAPFGPDTSGRQAWLAARTEIAGCLFEV